MGEVHAVHTCNECGRHENYRYHGENFNDFILLDVHQTQKGILKIIEPVEAEARIFKKRINVLDNHGKSRQQIMGK